MTALFKVAYRNLIYHLKWSIPTAISILIGVALMSGLSTIVSSYVMSTQHSLRALEGPSHLVAYNLSQQEIDELSNQDEIKVVEPIYVESYAKIKDYEILNKQSPYLKLIASNNSQGNIHGFTLSDGRYPENENEIVLSEKTLFYTNLDFKIGDEIILDLGQRLVDNQPFLRRQMDIEFEEFKFNQSKKYVVVGFISSLPTSIESFDEAGFTSIVYHPELRSNVNTVLIELDNPTQNTINSVNSLIKSYGREVIETNLLHTYFTGFNSLSNSPLYMVVFGSMIISVLIALASFLVIYNAFSINNRHLVTQLGTLDAIGATSSQKRNIILIQALLLGFVSIPIGLLLGYVVAALLLLLFRIPLVELIFFNQVVIYFYPLLLFFIVIVSFGALVLTALLTSYKISDLSSIESIKYFYRQMENAKPTKVPSFVKSIESKLAFINYNKNKNFYRSLTLSIIISIILIGTSVSLMTSLEKQNVTQRKDVVFEYHKDDIEDGKLIEIISALKSNPRLTQAGIWTTYSLMIEVNPQQVNPQFNYITGIESVFLDVEVIDDQYCQSVLEAQVSGFDCDTQSLFVDHFESSYLANENDIVQVQGHLFNEGDTVEFKLNRNDFVLDLSPETMKYTSEPLEDDPTLYVSLSRFDFLSTPFAIYLKESLGYDIGITRQIFVNSNNYLEAETSLRQTLNEHGIDNLAQVNNLKRTSVLENQLIQFYSILSLSMVFLIIFIALSNVINSMNHSLNLRVQEIGLLLSNGMTLDASVKMILVEVGLIGLVSFLIGIPTSILLTTLINWLLRLESVNPFRNWILITFICLVLVVMMMLISIGLSILSIKKLNVTQLTKE